MIDVETSGGIRTIRMNRPDKKNALTSSMYDAMAEALEQADVSDDVRVSLICGVPGAFSAGNDIGDFLSVAMTGEGLGTAVIRFLKAISASKKPVVAAVDGLAIGVGTTMLMHCDMVFASPRSTFKTPFLDLGLVPEAASSLIAPGLMGHARAFELLCLGTAFDAQRAREAGIVNHVVDEATLEDEARACAAAIAAKPAEALAIARKLIRGDVAAVHARIDEEAEAFRERLGSDEAKAAFQAFMSRGKAK
jgi:enoyl-CoA hydratase/carnithine racemase